MGNTSSERHNCPDTSSKKVPDASDEILPDLYTLGLLTLQCNLNRHLFRRKTKKHENNNLHQICLLFSSTDFFWKKECTGNTRLMRKGIWDEKNEKDDAGYFLKDSKASLKCIVPNYFWSSKDKCLHCRKHIDQLKLLNYGSFEANDLSEGCGRAYLPEGAVRIRGVLQREGLAGFLYNFLHDSGKASDPGAGVLFDVQSYSCTGRG